MFQNNAQNSPIGDLFRNRDDTYLMCILDCQRSGENQTVYIAGGAYVKGRIRIENARNIRVHGWGQLIRIYCPHPIFGRMHGDHKWPGEINGVIFRNISAKGLGLNTIRIDGYSREKQVRNVTLDNVTINGRKVSRSYPEVVLNRFTSSIRFRQTGMFAGFLPFYHTLAYQIYSICFYAYMIHLLIVFYLYSHNIIMHLFASDYIPAF